MLHISTLSLEIALFDCCWPALFAVLVVIGSPAELGLDELPYGWLGLTVSLYGGFPVAAELVVPANPVQPGVNRVTGAPVGV
jgi:hypothetical protein